MTAEIGKTYRIYGRMNKMKRMAPLGGGNFVKNLIYAELFTPQKSSQIESLSGLLKTLNLQGEFELREVKM